MSFWSSLDPTNSSSIWRKAARAVDPTSPNSIERQYIRQYDPTNKGSVWSYAAPVAAGVVAGPAAGAAVGAGEAALGGDNPIQGAAMGYGLGAAGSALSASAPASALPPPGGGMGGQYDTTTPRTTPNLPSPAATVPGAPNAGAGSGIAAILRAHPEIIPQVLGVAAQTYGAVRTGQAADRAAALNEARMTTPRTSYAEWDAERKRRLGLGG